MADRRLATPKRRPGVFYSFLSGPAHAGAASQERLQPALSGLEIILICGASVLAAEPVPGGYYPTRISTYGYFLKYVEDWLISRAYRNPDTENLRKRFMADVIIASNATQRYNIWGVVDEIFFPQIITDAK